MNKTGIASGVKAGQVVDWLKTDFDLGRGHAMALFALFKGAKRQAQAISAPHLVRTTER